MVRGFGHVGVKKREWLDRVVEGSELLGSKRAEERYELVRPWLVVSGLDDLPAYDQIFRIVKNLRRQIAVDNRQIPTLQLKFRERRYLEERLAVFELLWGLVNDVDDDIWLELYDNALIFFADVVF